MIYGVGVNIKTGEIFPATFPDKGPDQALRSARYLTGIPQVNFNRRLFSMKTLITERHVSGFRYLRYYCWVIKNWTI